MLSLETEISLVLGICLVLAFLINLISRKFKLPVMIAPLIAGLLLNYFQNYLDFLPSFSQILSLFANFGIIVVLFYIGLGVDFRYIKDLKRNSSIMALNAAHIPFLLGVYATYLYTRNWIVSIFVGIALAITAEEVTVGILEELGLLQKRVGQLIIEAGIIGDIIEIAAIAILGLFIKSKSVSGSMTIFNILFELFIFILFIMVLRYYLIELLLRIPQKKKYEYFAVAFILLLVMVLVSELLNFSYIIGALLAGILLKDKLVEDKLYYEEHHILEALEVFNFGIFHPLVFIWIGLSMDLNLLSANIGFGLVLTGIALFGKLVGSMLGNYFCKEPISEGILIGWGLNARGATELFALLIARNQNIISQDIFSAVVFMALVTTIISPIIFKYLVLRGYGIVRHYHRRRLAAT